MLDVGNVIKNRYKITGIIHSSKYSTVYTALDFNLNQEVILKAFTIRVRNPHQIKVAMKKFEKRIIALVSMKHPGIPKFYDYFTKGTQQFLVMEYIPGRNLGKLIEDSFVPVYEPDAVSICIQITDTLNFLHSQSTPVVFKDLKPSHIMVTPDDGIRLIDFGLSHFFKPVGETRKKKVNLHGYAPPEQFAQDVYNEKTDLYPVGVILHQMVTLRDPTDLKNMYKFPPASSINPKITLELDEIIAKATAYRPEIRFGTAGEFHRVLDNHLQRWELLSKRRLIKPRKTEEIEAKLKSTSTEKPEETQDKARETVTIPNAETVKPRSHFKRRSKKKEKKPDKTASDKKSSKPFINNKLLINLTIILILILAILWVLKGYAVKPGQPGNPSEPRSPYALSHDKELAEIRKKGIKLYKKGYNNNDKKVLTEALSYLTKIKYANQADVEVQVYWQNSHVLLSGKDFLKVGALLSITGENFEAGRQMLAGIGLAQENHNKKEDIPPVVVEVYDDKSSLSEAVALATEVSKNDGLLAVIGPVRSSFLLNTAPFFEKSKIVQVAPTAVCSDLENLGSYIFRSSGDGRYLGKKMGEFSVNELGLKRIAVIYDQFDPYSSINGKIFLNTVKELKKSDTKELHLSLEETDYSPVVDELKEYHPDGVFFVGYHQHQAKLAKKMKEAGIKTIHLATVATYSNQLITQGGDSVEGLTFQSFFFPESPFETQKNFTKEYLQKYGGVTPNFRSAMAYDSMLVISEAIVKGAETPTELADYIKEELKISDKLLGATGVLSFDKNGCREEISLIPISVQNGQFKLYNK